MKNLFALIGSAITGPIAPVTFPLGGASALLETPVGPKAGAGPWVTKFWFTWTCANAAIGIVETDARSTQPTSRLNITPPAASITEQARVDFLKLTSRNAFFLAVLLKKHSTGWARVSIGFWRSVAWAHDCVSDPPLAPLFQALPGASFVVNGASLPQNSALASAGGELRLANGVTLLAKFDGEFASHSSTDAGTGTLHYRW
jgi:hypothetical protein